VTGEQDLWISIGFEKWRQDFAIGIIANQMDPIIKEKINSSNIISRIGRPSLKKNHAPWYYLHYYENRAWSNWNNPEIWCAILDGALAGELCRQLAFIVEELKRIGVVQGNA